MNHEGWYTYERRKALMEQYTSLSQSSPMREVMPPPIVRVEKPSKEGETTTREKMTDRGP